MIISETELSRLIALSTRDHLLSLSFGPGWVLLIDIESNAWAFSALRSIRKEDPEDA